jgi:S-formylglutathione hydrolase
MEPGVEPALRFADVKLRNSFQRGRPLIEARYGHPVNEAFWQANNPANLAIARQGAIAAARLAIFLDVGDLDMFHIDEGTEFLHRVLWDQRLAHEYRLLHGADHLGRSLPGRVREALKFLDAQVLRPPPPDTSYEAGKRLVDTLKRFASLDDTGPRPPLPPTTAP